MAASDKPTFLAGALAGGNLSSNQYYLVKMDSTANQVVVCTGATDIPIGSLYDKPTAAGQGCEVAGVNVSDVIKVKVGAAGVTAGWVGTDASGLLVTKTTDKDFAIGRVDASWDSGDIAPVRCMPCFLGV